MKKIFTLFLFALFFFGTDSTAQSITRLVGASAFQDSLWVFDTTNFAVTRRLAPSPSSGGSVTGTNGVTKNPLNGTIYVVFKQSAVSGRVLAKLDPLTGVYTIIGNLGDNFSSITFTSDGKLYGATGDGATVPETLYQIDTATAAIRLVKTLGNGADGEIICYNSSDNMIYHWSGNTTAPVIFEKFDTITGPYNFTNIPITGDTGEIFGACYLGNNQFLTSDISSRFEYYYTNGLRDVQHGNTTPDDIRGTALLTCSRAIAGSTSFCTGSNTTLTFGSASAAGYQWYLNGAAIAGATSQSYTANQPGHYNCFVIDACGSDSLGAGVDVIENPLPVVNVSSAQTNLCPNGSITITGTGGGTLQWYMNGSPIVGANSSTYTATAPGVYNETKTNLNGCTDSAAVGVTIVAVPNPVVNIGNDTAICSGDTITLDAMNAGATYSWSPSGNTAQTEMVFSTNTYIAFVTDGNGCTSSDTMNLTVHSLPVVNLGNDTATCATNVLLDAGNPGSTYLWCDGSTTQTITLITSSVCQVIVTDANGCVNSDTISVTINPLPTVTATAAVDTMCINAPPVPLSGSPFGGTFTGPGTSGVTFTPSAAGAGPGTVYYTYTDGNGCSATDSIMMLVNPLPSVTMSSASSTVCLDDANVALTGTPAGGTFSGTGVSGSSFSPMTAGTGTHTITYSYTDVNGCGNTATANITVNSCVGITEHSNAGGVSIFPNPANTEVQITLNAGSTVSVFNALGENVMNLQLAEGKHTIDLSGLAAGIYFVQAQNITGISTQRLMINR